jgi:hypothetical protein
MGFVHRQAVLLFVVAAVGCTSAPAPQRVDVQIDTVATAGSNASVAGASAEANITMDAQCFDPATIEPCGNFTRLRFSDAPAQIYDVSAVGSDLRFSALGGMVALAESADGSRSQYTLVSIRATGGGPEAVDHALEPHAVVWPELEPGSFEVLGVWGNGHVAAGLRADLLALACDMARTRCAILGATHGVATPMQALLAVELPQPVLQALRGLTYLDGPCVYGSGMYCSDASGGWRQELDPSAASDIQHVGFSALVVAADADGDVFYREGETWQSLRIGGAPVRHVGAYTDRISVMRADGVWIRGNPSSLRACQQVPQLVAAGENSSANGVGQTVVDANGNVFWLWWDTRRAAQAWCRFGSIELTANVIDWSSFRCNDSTNMLLLTERGIYSLLSKRLYCALT